MALLANREQVLTFLNSMYRCDRKEMEIRNIFGSEDPLLKVKLSHRKIEIKIISKHAFEKVLLQGPEALTYSDLMVPLVRGSGINRIEDIKSLEGKMRLLIGAREVSLGDRPVCFLYDTCALMNNIHMTVISIANSINKLTMHTTSLGVQNELEEKMDMRFKSKQKLQECEFLYKDRVESFLYQPMKVGRLARLAYPGIEMLKRLSGSIINEPQKGDTGILNAFHTETMKRNIDGVVVTCDKMMSERAENRAMKSILVNHDNRSEDLIASGMDSISEFIYRTAILTGGVEIIGSGKIWGIWKGKNHDDWKNERVLMETDQDEKISSMKRVLEGLL